MMRKTVDTIKYSDDFRALVEAEYGHDAGVMRALGENSYMLGRWLDDSRYFGMSPEQIIAAFKNGTERKVLQAAETSIRRTALYAAWDRQVFTEEHDGSAR